MKRLLLISVLLLAFLVSGTRPVHGASYNYSPLAESVYAAEAMIVETVIDSANLVDVSGSDVDLSFGELVDVFGYEDDIYLVDRTNGLVHVLDSEYRYLRSFGQDIDVPLRRPNGIFVTDEHVYVADTDNYRIVLFDHDDNVVSTITAPDDPTFKQDPTDAEGYDFKPLKLAVHRTGRVYVVADQIFEGILDFNPDGTFSRYVGANTVTLSLWDAFWLNFTTAEQRAAQGFRLATTFNNLNIDEMGYLYTVSGPEEGDLVIKKLNYRGNDVLTRNGYVPQTGDIGPFVDNDAITNEPSVFIDIDVNAFGNYIALDRTRGRLFTYDFEGNLLYVAGQLNSLNQNNNNQRDLFLRPEALAYHNDRVLVVDSMNRNLVVFGYTEYGALVNEATRLYHDGDYQGAKDTWEAVLRLNTNYFLAYAGIAKAELREGNYARAMEYAALGYDDATYSSAYQPYRYERIADVFPYLVALAFIGLFVLFYRSMKGALARAKEEDDV
jgi:tetratricopeptide (TPR) repeat protein